MRMNTIVRHSVGVLASALILSGCGDTNRNDMASNTADSMSMRGEQPGMIAMDSGVNPGVAAGGMGPDGLGRQGVGGAQGRDSEIRLTDAQIVSVAMTANRLDSTSAATVLNRLNTNETRAFAQRMIAEHGAMMESMRAATSRLGLTPVGNNVSSTLEQMASQRINGTGADVDRAYMENEVVMHQQVLRTIDEVLLPQATDPTLRGLVERMRTSVAAHLEEAGAIRERLAER